MDTLENIYVEKGQTRGGARTVLGGKVSLRINQVGIPKTSVKSLPSRWLSIA